MPLRSRVAAAMARRFGSSRLVLPDGREVRGLVRDRVDAVVDASGQQITERQLTARVFAGDVRDLPRHTVVTLVRDDLGETEGVSCRVADLFPIGDGQHVVCTLVRLS